MKTDDIIEHPALGRLNVVVNPRARRFTFRATENGLRVSVPLRATKKELLQCIDAMLDRLLKLKERQQNSQKSQVIEPGFSIMTEDLRVEVVAGDVERARAQLAKGVLTITLPKGCVSADNSLQEWCVKVIEEALRYQSKRIMPARIAELAKLHGFSFSRVSIHKTKGRWGSCSMRGNINLSIYLLLLPRHLQDYVMLHELCHTVELNHSPRFWSLLDKVSNGCSEQLRNEMKSYNTSVFYSKSIE